MTIKGIDRYDKIIINSYWLYRDDLITSEAFIEIINKIKSQEKLIKQKFLEEEELIVKNVERKKKK